MYFRNILYNNFFPRQLSRNFKKYINTSIPKTELKMVYLYRLWKIYYITKPFKKTDLIVSYKTKSCIQHPKPKYLTKKKKRKLLSYIYIYVSVNVSGLWKDIHRPDRKIFRKRYKEHLFSFRSNKMTTLAGRLMTLWRSCISVERGHTWSPLKP
jgi:hypothetical protein